MMENKINPTQTADDLETEDNDSIDVFSEKLELIIHICISYF